MITPRPVATLGAMALITGLAQAAVHAEGTPNDGRSSALGETPRPSTSSAGGRIRIVLTGDVPPTAVPVRVVGVKGKATGWTTRVKVKKSKIVKKVRKSGRTKKPLPTGTYRIISPDTTAAGATFTATRPTVKVAPKKVRKVRVRYTLTSGDTPQSDAPQAQPPTTPTQPPAAPTQPPAPPTQPPTDNPPGPVSGLQARVLSDKGIELSWTNPGDADLAEVIVVRSTGAAPTSPTDGTVVPLASPLATSVTDSGLTYDTAYTYGVFTKDAAGNVTGPVTVTATTDPAKVFATAWSEGNGTPGFQENSADDLIARVFDKNQSGVVDAGDEITLGSAPTDFAGGRTPLQAGSLPVTSLLFADATQCVVVPGAGVMTFNRNPALELWDDGGTSGTSTLTDIVANQGRDSIILNPLSNTQPAQSTNLLGPAVGQATDDDFLQIEVNCQ